MQGLPTAILGASIVFLCFLLVCALIYYFISAKRVKEQKEVLSQMHQDLKPGVKVMFAGGLFGTLKRVDEETCDIEVKSGAVMEVSRYAIQQIIK